MESSFQLSEKSYLKTNDSSPVYNTNIVQNVDPEYHQNYGNNTAKTGNTTPSPNVNNTVKGDDQVGYKVSLSKDGSKDGKKSIRFFELSRKSKLTLVLCTSAATLVNCALSLLGPFFPIEAEKKGMGLALSGFVFSVFEIMIFLTAPFYGNYLTKLGPKFVYVAGMSVGGICNILFGTLNMCPNGTPFIVMSLVCRAVEGVGFSGFVTSSFAIVAAEFPDNVGMALGILETGGGIGFMIGPTIGGVLYELGGYGLPFYSAGILVLLNALVVFLFLPDIKIEPSERKRSIFYLLKGPMIMFTLFCVFSGTLAITCFDATVAKHLQPFHLSTGIVGVIFGAVALLYSITAPIWGYITDVKEREVSLLLFGQVSSGIGYLLIGPSIILPFIPFKLWIVCFGVLLIGIGFGMSIISAMKCLLKGACELGFDNNIDTYGLVSGLFNSTFTIAGVAGPIGIGALIQLYEFPIAYSIVALINFSAMFSFGSFFLARRWKKGRINEYKSLDTESIIFERGDTKQDNKTGDGLTRSTSTLSVSRLPMGTRRRTLSGN